ncbi:MAG: fasciclin domain-containing protein [Cryomorphaceae bacterium]|nr:fasciclin domain-containing protein [Flavobacteriales bacterium]
MTKHFKFLSYLGLAAGLLVFTSCNDDDDDNGTPPAPPAPTQSIVEIAAATPEYSILVEALTATGVLAEVSQDGPFTVFAPDNAAFETLFAELGVDDAAGLIDALGSEAVAATLRYHVLGASIPAADVPEDAYVTTASTSSPVGNQLSLRVQAAGGVVTLNGGKAAVNNADIMATNGVIHGIDNVLLMPTIVDHALNNDVFTELVGALTTAELVETLSGDGPFTVMAPTNAAFEEISDVVAGLTIEELSNILRYHVVSGNVQSEDLNAGPVPTLADGDATFTVNLNEDDTVSITDGSGGESTIFLVDVQGTNGVVHVIDRVLLP